MEADFRRWLRALAAADGPRGRVAGGVNDSPPLQLANSSPYLRRKKRQGEPLFSSAGGKEEAERGREREMLARILAAFIATTAWRSSPKRVERLFPISVKGWKSSARPSSSSSSSSCHQWLFTRAIDYPTSHAESNGRSYEQDKENSSLLFLPTSLSSSLPRLAGRTGWLAKSRGQWPIYIEDHLSAYMASSPSPW